MLTISPNKFGVKVLEVKSIDAFEFNEKSPLMLDVEASRLDDNKVEITLLLTLKLSETTGMKVSYAVDFSVLNDKIDGFKVTDEVLKDVFIKVNAPAIAYPFLRSFVATFCVNAGYEVVLLRPVNFQAMYNAQQAEQKAVPSEH